MPSMYWTMPYAPRTPHFSEGEPGEAHTGLEAPVVGVVECPAVAVPASQEQSSRWSRSTLD